MKRRKRTSEPAPTCRQSLTEGAASFGPENHVWLDMYTIDRSKVAQHSGTIFKHACTRSGTSRSSPNTSHSLKLKLCVLPETGRTWVIHLGGQPEIATRHICNYPSVLHWMTMCMLHVPKHSGPCFHVILKTFAL